ncbi:MAG: 30S ribosomal protein S20 [Candidatus Bipolaricaulota bacterium]
MISIPIIESAKKRLRQNKKRKELNQKRKKDLKAVTKKLGKLIDQGKKSDAEELLPELMEYADKAARKGSFHKNKASRIKSKYAKLVNDIE